MNKQRARQLYELADRLSKLDVNTLSEEQLQQRSTMIAKLQEEVKEGIVDADKEPGEYDQEGSMARQDLATAANAAEELRSILDSDENLPEWVQSKITKAVDYLDTVRDYMKSKDQDVTEGNDHSLEKVWDRYSKHLMAARGHHPSVKQINKSGEILQNIRKYVRDHHGQKAVDDMERYAEKQKWNEDVTEDSQRVDSLVTDALRIMKGSEVSDAVSALKTVLGDREYNGRRGHYNFYVRQILDMYSQQGVTETKKPSPKLTAVNIKKTNPVSEEINTEAYERLQKVFAFKNYES